MKLEKQVLFLGLGALIVGIMMLLFGGDNRLSAASANGSDSDSLVVVPLTIGRESYGIAMINKDTETIWIYEIAGRAAGASRLNLVAARSWRYDKLLEEYNSGNPTPERVKAIIEQFASKPKQAAEIDVRNLSGPNDINDLKISD